MHKVICNIYNKMKTRNRSEKKTTHTMRNITSQFTFFPLHPVFNMDFNFFELKSVVTVHVYILFMFYDDTDWLDRSLHVRFIRQFLRFYLIITFFSVFVCHHHTENAFSLCHSHTYTHLNWMKWAAFVPFQSNFPSYLTKEDIKFTKKTKKIVEENKWNPC